MWDRIEGALRRTWRFRWLVAMNLYLLSPLFFELHVGRGGPDRSIFFTLPASVLWLLTAQLAVRRVWLVHLAMAPLYFTAGLDLYVIAHYRTRLTSSMILTIFENLADAAGYVRGFYGSIFIPIFALAVGYTYAIRKIRPLEIAAPRRAALLPLGALAVLYVGVHHILCGWMVVATADRSSPFGVLPQTYVTISLHREAIREAKQAESFTFGASRRASPPEPEVYVLVIGESSRSLNWQLYGYPRETNPRLARDPNLVVFRDVVTQAAATRTSVPLILTRGTIEDEQRTAREKSIVSAFHESGFRTYWLSTQQREPFTGAVNRYPKEADVARFFDRWHDMVLVDTFGEMLEKDGPPKAFFVLHTLGSHFTHTNRYPRSFNVFHDDDAGLTERERLINTYDNTILYTDHVLAELIEALKRRPGIKAMFYVSDHGDNLRDDDRRLFGHGYNNEYDLPIPMLFWYSDDLAQRHPEKVAAARANAAELLSTRVMFHSLLDLADIDVHDPDTARFSVLSPALSRYRRMVLGEPKPFDFDRWRGARGALLPHERHAR